MNLILDTHVLLWWFEAPESLSIPCLEAMTNPDNSVYISSVVALEITIKTATRKLKGLDDLEGLMRANHFLPLPVTIAHALAVGDLPVLHRDPFDRLLIAQALSEGFVLVSRDPIVARYPVPLLVA